MLSHNRAIVFYGLIAIVLYRVEAESGMTTIWDSVDNINGVGDIEPYPAAPGPCGDGSEPSVIEVRVKDTTEILVHTWQTLQMGPNWGLKCLNSQQPTMNPVCEDYECRFIFNDSPWANEDHPIFQASLGDIEIPPESTGVREVWCRAIGNTHLFKLKDNIRVGPTIGVRCFHEDQVDRRCENYEVRYGCAGYR